MTIVLTTHYLDEADAMAERVMVIDHGVVIADDTADRLKAELAGDRIVLVTDGDVSARRVVELAGRVAEAQEVDVDAGDGAACGSWRGQAPCPACSGPSTPTASTYRPPRSVAPPSTTSS